MYLKELGLLSKSSNFIHFGPHDLVQISTYAACSPNTYQLMYGETLDIQFLGLQTVVRESLNSKFTAKNDFLIGYFRLPLLKLTLEV